jgi:aspartate aminotransferase
MDFAERINSVEPSATLAITSSAKAMIAEGKDVIILAAGEPAFDTPDQVKDAAVKAIKDGKTKYTPAAGTVSLKKAICRKFKEENDLEYEPKNIVVSNGAKQCLYNIFQVLCEKGDEVLIVSPYWLSYSAMVKLAGGVPKILRTERANGFKITPNDIETAVSDKTKAIIFNSPSNPAGVVYDKAELEAIAEVCVCKGLTIVSDEIYEKIIYDGREHVSIASVSEEAFKNTVVVNGVSKSFSMTGWRIGYVAGPEGLIKKISTLQSHATSNPCSISQAAAECALEGDFNSWLEENRKGFEDKRDQLFDLLSASENLDPYKPGGAFYLFCDISKTGMDSVTFAKNLLQEKMVAVIPGGPFGEDGYIRISFATDMAKITEGIGRMREWLKS